MTDIYKNSKSTELVSSQHNEVIRHHHIARGPPVVFTFIYIKSMLQWMKVPNVHGIIDRRILINYQIDPVSLENILPDPFRPKLVDGKAIGGICLIRLKDIRPRLVPSFLGLNSENAAHRIAVEWDGGEGVWIPRRDTSSRLNTMLGGRIFPGVHHLAEFEVNETDSSYEVNLRSLDDNTSVEVKTTTTTEFSKDSIFQSLEQASQFFEKGSLGYSNTEDMDYLDGLELRTDAWQVEPLKVEHVYSSYFQDNDAFSEGDVKFDCALLMRDIPHKWQAMDPLVCGSPVSSA